MCALNGPCVLCLVHVLLLSGMCVLCLVHVLLCLLHVQFNSAALLHFIYFSYWLICDKPYIWYCPTHSTDCCQEDCYVGFLACTAGVQSVCCVLLCC